MDSNPYDWLYIIYDDLKRNFFKLSDHILGPTHFYSNPLSQSDIYNNLTEDMINKYDALNKISRSFLIIIGIESLIIISGIIYLLC